jgi:hypothetical protein
MNRQTQPIGEPATYPYATTRAARALSDALNEMSTGAQVSLRTIAGRLNYKSAVVLSHMRTGRLPIPVERAIEIAHAVGLEPEPFLALVLEQRYPDVDLTKALTGASVAPLRDVATKAISLLDELKDLAGMAFEDLPAPTIGVIREVVSDPRPRRRWLGVSEARIMDIIRDERPDLSSDGVSADQAEQLRSALKRIR